MGAFGLDVRDGAEVVIADRPEALATACVALRDDPARHAALARRASNLVSRRHRTSTSPPPSPRHKRAPRDAEAIQEELL